MLKSELRSFALYIPTKKLMSALLLSCFSNRITLILEHMFGYFGLPFCLFLMSNRFHSSLVLLIRLKSGLFYRMCRFLLMTRGHLAVFNQNLAHSKNSFYLVGQRIDSFPQRTCSWQRTTKPSNLQILGWREKSHWRRWWLLRLEHIAGWRQR